MALDQSQQQTFQSWIAAKGVRNDCPSCGAREQWVAGDIVASLEMSRGGFRISGDNLTPVVQLICGNCAYVMLFAAEPVGLWSDRRR